MAAASSLSKARGANRSSFSEAEADQSGLRRRYPCQIGRYWVSTPIGAGGMAQVHLGSEAGSKTVVALKRLHPHLTADGYFTKMLLDEARIAASVRHENVVSTFGAEFIEGAVHIMMEYVPGLPLSALMKKGPVSPRFAVAIVAAALRGLHAAHETQLGIIHRDVSPQNILVGADGIARVLDFGIAKAKERNQNTRAGEIKGKLAYMAPEQLLQHRIDRRIDIRAAAVVLWEALVGKPLFRSDNEGGTVQLVLNGTPEPPSRHVRDLPAALDRIILKALARRKEERFATALDMAVALENVFAPVTRAELSQWVHQLGAEQLAEHATIEQSLKRRASMPSVTPIPATRRSARRGRRGPSLAQLHGQIQQSQSQSIQAVQQPQTQPPPAPAPAPLARPRHSMGALIFFVLFAFVIAFTAASFIFARTNQAAARAAAPRTLAPSTR